MFLKFGVFGYIFLLTLTRRGYRIHELSVYEGASDKTWQWRCLAQHVRTIKTMTLNDRLQMILMTSENGHNGA